MDNKIVSSNKYQNKKNNKYKIEDREIKILTYQEYHILRKQNFKVNELKAMCRYYKLKLSGNKTELKQRLYNYLKFSFK